MKAGDLRYSVTLQSPTLAQDSFGQPTPGWSDFATVPAAIEPLNGRELVAAQQIDAETTTRIRVRYMPGVLQNMRVAWSDPALGGAVVTTYNIQQIVDVGMRHRELQLMCSSGLIDG